MRRILIAILLTTSLFAKDIIAVLDLEQNGLTPEDANILTQRLTTKLISIDRYQVVERTNMDKILKEQKFQKSGCTDSECAVEIGQLLNTDFIVIGTVSKFHSTYAVDARLIDVAQGKSLISAEYSMEGKIDVLLTKGMASIAKQLCELPAQKTAEATQVVIPPVVNTESQAKIVSNPPGAIVYLDETIIGSTPFFKWMEHGTYVLSFEKAGYDNLSKNITFEGGDEIIKVDLIRQQGYLQCAFEPQEAIVTIDGETVANNTTSLLDTRGYKLTAKLTNYYLVNEFVSISKDDTTYVNHTLQYGLDDYKKLLKQNKKHGILSIIPIVFSITTFAGKTYYNSKYEDATSGLVKSHYQGIYDAFDTAFTVSSSITMGTGLYISYNRQRAKTLKFQLSL